MKHCHPRFLNDLKENKSCHQTYLVRHEKQELAINHSMRSGGNIRSLFSLPKQVYNEQGIYQILQNLKINRKKYMSILISKKEGCKGWPPFFHREIKRLKNPRLHRYLNIYALIPTLKTTLENETFIFLCKYLRNIRVIIKWRPWEPLLMQLQKIELDIGNSCPL